MGYRVKVAWRRPAAGRAPLPPIRHPLALPAGETAASIAVFLAGYHIQEDGPSAEREQYLRLALRRFLYTLQLVPEGTGELLEIGANPYFISLLLRRYRGWSPTFVNYFGPAYGDHAHQTLVGPDGEMVPVPFDNVDVEAAPLPYADGRFQVVLLCEVLEHFTDDPCWPLIEIRRVLAPGGTLVLTTPNAASLINVARLAAGENVHDAYSAYGPHGRHNREYTAPEVRRLLREQGFGVEELFTSDVHPDPAPRLPSAWVAALRRERPGTLGQYIFVRARARARTNGHLGPRRPPWLYRSYPPETA